MQDRAIFYCTTTHHVQCQTKLGVKRHTVFSFLTILLQDQIDGLQVLYDIQWADVPLIPGSLTVNIGDLLHVCIDRDLR